MIKLRAARAGDVEALTGKSLPVRSLFVSLEQDGAVIGTGGLLFARDGKVWVTAELTAAARAAKLTLHRAGLRILKLARARGLTRLHALCDPRVPRAAAWLTRCGFVRTARFAETPQGRQEIWIFDAASPGAPRARGLR